MKDMILFPEDIDRLNSVLSQLVAKANILLAVLINKDGRMLTSQGGLDHVDTVSMAALVAGNTASSIAIAQLMGETEFSTMYHQGKNKHIYLAIVDDNTFLSLIFDDRTNIDRVKVFVRQFERQLTSALEQVYDKTEDQIHLDLDMFSMQPSSNNQQQQYNAPLYAPPPHGNSGNAAGVNNNQDYFEQNGAIHNSYNQQSPYQPPNSNNFSEMQSNNNKNDDDNFFNMEAATDTQSSIDLNDTNQLFLQNKIKETIKRKKDE
jgi:predicted regulator of Ras-like GTPase activity (Roadblock/LC7/MglB family)